MAGLMLGWLCQEHTDPINMASGSSLYLIADIVHHQNIFITAPKELHNCTSHWLHHSSVLLCSPDVMSCIHLDQEFGMADLRTFPTQSPTSYDGTRRAVILGSCCSPRCQIFGLIVSFFAVTSRRLVLHWWPFSC